MLSFQRQLSFPIPFLSTPTHPPTSLPPPSLLFFFLPLSSLLPFSLPQGSVKMYPLPDDGSPEPERMFSHIPSTDPVNVIVRVYVIRVRSNKTSL